MEQLDTGIPLSKESNDWADWFNFEPYSFNRFCNKFLIVLSSLYLNFKLHKPLVTK